MKYDTAGTYTLKYTAADECGNETVRERTVTVREVAKKTTLFTDGTLIINELSSDRASNITSHGAVVAEYVPLDESNPYNFTGTSQRPWQDKAGKVKTVKFGSTVKPVSIAYWFQACDNFESIDFTNLDGSEVTTARAFCSGTKVKSLTFPSMPKLTTIRYICNQCGALQEVAFTEPAGTALTDTQDAFQGCYVLKVADLSGLGGTVATSTRMFANMTGGDDMAINTIYATKSLDFSQATSSSSMFRSDTSLVGGNGTIFDSSKTNNAYARCDCACQQGYFTCEDEDCMDICGGFAIPYILRGIVVGTEDVIEQETTVQYNMDVPCPSATSVWNDTEYQIIEDPVVYNVLHDNGSRTPIDIDGETPLENMLSTIEPTDKLIAEFNISNGLQCLKVTLDVGEVPDRFRGSTFKLFNEESGIFSESSVDIASAGLYEFTECNEDIIESLLSVRMVAFSDGGGYFFIPNGGNVPYFGLEDGVRNYHLEGEIIQWGV